MSSPSRQRAGDSSDSPPPSATSPRTLSYFPIQDWPSRHESTSRNHLRHGSTTSSIGSIGGTLDIQSQARSSTARETGQNAISTLLQPPITRTGLLPHTSATASSSHRPPSTRDIPPVTLTNIPHVETTVFKPYLSQVGTLWDAFQRAKADNEGALSQWIRKDKDPNKDDEFAELLERKLRTAQGPPPTPRHSSIAALSPTESLPLRRRSSGGASRRNVHAITPLSTIPSVYFEDNFHLENPRTFDIVSERSEVVRQPHRTSSGDARGANGFANGAPTPGRKALATNAILQEKLSWYMDTVEIHLISSISQASASFFAALGSLRELQSEAADSVARIKRLREDLLKLDQDMAVGGLQIIGMKRRRENLRKLTEATEQLRCVVDGATHCEELMESGELETAIERIDILERFAAGTFYHTSRESLWLSWDPSRAVLDLRRLKALDGFTEGMNQLRYRIGKGFEARFLEALLADLRHHVSSVSTQDTLLRWASASQRSRGGHIRTPSGFPAYQKTSEKLRTDLLAILKGLDRSKHTMPASAAFRDAIMREMKSLIRQNLPSSSDDDAESVTSVSTSRSRALSQQEKSTILSRNLRALDAEDAEKLLVTMYCAVGEALRRLGTQVKVLLDVTSRLSTMSPTLRPSSPPRSPNRASIDSALTTGRSRANSNLQEELTHALDLSSLLGQAVDVAQTQITKILKVRSESTAKLPLEHFLRYFTLNRLFADECEAVSGRSGVALKNVVNNHIIDFVPIMSDTEKQQLAQKTESDKWEAKDFGDAPSATLSRILEGMTSDPPLWLSRGYVWESVENHSLDPANAASETNGATKEKARTACIDEENFILTSSALSILSGLERFGILIVGIPSISSSVSTALLEYLKLFNSRSQQLILGAGATKTAGLKNINTKHLALASQSLSFIIALIPYIREFVRRRPGMGGQQLAEFDRVKRQYHDHQTQIHDKFVDIMSGRGEAHLRSMKKIDWDELGAKGGADASPYMETLTKETLTVHRVLSKHLPETSVRMIMQTVFDHYREQWGPAFIEARVGSEAGKERLLRDAELFDLKLGKIDGSGDLSKRIRSIVIEKKVQGAVTPAQENPPAVQETNANGHMSTEGIPPDINTAANTGE